MASLVSEILMSAGQLEKRDLQSEIDKVTQKIEDAKFGVAKFLEQHYAEFNPLLVHSRELNETAKSIAERVSELVSKAETELKFQLDSSSNELNSISSQIEAAKIQAGLLERVAQLHTVLESLKKMNMESDTVRYAQAVAQADSILSQTEDGLDTDAGQQADTELDIWGSVQFEIQRHKDRLVEHLEESWNSRILWTETGLKLDNSTQGKLEEIFVSLTSAGQLDRLLCEWSARLLEQVLVPLLKADSVLNVEEDQMDLREGQQNVTDLAHLEVVLANILTAIRFLSSRLGFEVDGARVLRLVGRQVADQFVQALIKSCLKPTLPDSSELLSGPEYQAAMQAIMALEGHLLDAQFLEDRLLAQFAANVDVFFADKQCLESLSRARRLMCADLHDTVQLDGRDGQDETVVNPDHQEETAHLWKMLGEGGSELKWSPFRFPACQVSRSVQELVQLITGLVEQASLASATERCIARLLFTVRSVCELYVSVVPEYHRKELAELPFHAAIAHNNSMFLAHSILTLGTGHLIKLPRQNAVPLMDLVGKFRTLAAQIFLDHMKRQRDIIMDNFKQAGFNRLSEGESRLPASAEKAGRQCLTQLSNLHKIWRPALPDEVYLRAIGTLSNALLDQLLARVTAMEDIPADAAAQLTDQCRTISETMPKLFSAIPSGEDEEVEEPSRTQMQQQLALVQQHVHLWHRFQELRHLLSAGLKDIEDRWSSGKGPLAAHFTADEVKQMIRALFQNTDIRAATLSRIK